MKNDIWGHPSAVLRNLVHWVVTTAAHARTYVVGPTLSSFLRSIEMEYFDISCKICNLLWWFWLVHNSNITAVWRTSLAFGVMPAFNEYREICVRWLFINVPLCFVWNVVCALGVTKMATLQSFKVVCVHSSIEFRDYLRLLKLGTNFGIHFSAKRLFGVQTYVLLVTKIQSTLLKHNRRASLSLLLFVCFPGVTTHCGCIFHSPVAGFSLLVFRGFLITHNDVPQSVGLLWTSDESVAETSMWQHTTLTTDKHPCPRWDSNPRSQQASGRRPTP